MNSMTRRILVALLVALTWAIVVSTPVSSGRPTDWCAKRSTHPHCSTPRFARTNIRILNNVSDTRVGGPVITASGCNGLTNTGNVQPLSSGSLASTTDCSNVVISGNTTQ